MREAVRVVAVVDPDPGALDRIKSLAPDALRLTDLSQLFGSDVANSVQREIKGAIVCTPPSVRIPIVEQLLARKIGVLIEKPLAHTLADARAIEKLGKQHAEVPAFVGYCHRYTPAVVEMRCRADAGELGELIRFENTFACWFPSMQGHWMSDPQRSGGGSFMDTGCHSLDLFRYLVGNASMTAAMFTGLWKDRGESNATVLLRSVSTARHTRVAGVIASGWAEPARFELRLTGTRGALAYDYEKPTELRWIPSEGTPQAIEVRTHDDRFDLQLADFVRTLRGESAVGQPASLADGAEVARMVDECRRFQQII